MYFGRITPSCSDSGRTILKSHKYSTVAIFDQARKAIIEKSQKSPGLCEIHSVFAQLKEDDLAFDVDVIS
jgi:hypothetical protein